MSRGWVAAALVLAACGHDEPGPTGDAGGDELTCMEADLEVWREVAAHWDDPDICRTDADCTLETPVVECPAEGNFFEACPWARHVDSRAELEAALDAAATAVCSRVHGCRAGPMCQLTQARCGAFACVTVVPETCVSSCEALGCAECVERCVVSPACVAGAASCDAASACDTGRLMWAAPYDESAHCWEPEVVVGILDAPLKGGSGDVTCGVGPDGRPYVFFSGSRQTAVDFPDCPEPLRSEATGASPCP